MQRKVQVTEGATPGPNHSICMHRCSKQKALFSDAAPPCPSVVLPHHHHQSFPLVQQVLSLAHPSSFVDSLEPPEAQAEEQERMWERVLGGGQQRTPARYAGGKKIVILLPTTS